MAAKKKKKLGKVKRKPTGIVFDQTWVDALLGYMVARKRVAG